MTADVALVDTGSYVIGVDIGGTFTDCVVVDESGATTVAKAFSTPLDFSAGVIDAVEVAAETLGSQLTDLLARARLFLHATSIAENAIVDGSLAPAGLLVTRGFEDTLYMARGGYGRWSGLTEDEKKDVLAGDKPRPIVPGSMIRGIRERTDAAGTVLAAAEDAEIEAALKDLVAAGVQGIGVAFLWSFRNPRNELAVRRNAERLFPELFVTLASELAPVEGEYERTSTVALNVRLGPIVGRYLGQLRRRLETAGFRGSFMVMQANGGLQPIDEAPGRAVGMIESGPVAGLVGSRAVGDLIDLPRILATDMGGTTFKAGVIRDGRIDYEREPRVLRYHYSLQKMELVSIGLAGGSIVALDEETGVPKVGPRSAGAAPGPVCYGFGGAEPTVTDVDLILGYLDRRYFLGGRATLDADAARRAFTTRIARPLRMDAIEAAGAVQRLANSMMFDLLHKQTVEKGLDPRQYAMFAYGGSAGMHMTSIGPELGVSQIVVPHSASVHGAFGLVSSDVVYVEVTTRQVRLPADPEAVSGIFKDLSDRLMKRVSQAGFAGLDVHLQRAVDMRYQRQVHAIATPVDGELALTSADLDRIRDRFEALYAERYGREAGYREAGTEMVSFLVRATVRVEKPRPRSQPIGAADPGDAMVESRDAYFGATDSMIRTRCYDFDRLRPGSRVEGPAIIWTPITTVVVNPGQTAACDAYRNLVITWPAVERYAGGQAS